MTFGIGEAFVNSSSAAMVAEFCKERHYGTGMGTLNENFGYHFNLVVIGIE